MIGVSGAVSSAVRASVSHTEGHWFESSTAQCKVGEKQSRAKVNIL